MYKRQAKYGAYGFGHAALLVSANNQWYYFSLNGEDSGRTNYNLRWYGSKNSVNGFTSASTITGQLKKYSGLARHVYTHKIYIYTEILISRITVSYTHLDVYKRQQVYSYEYTDDGKIASETIGKYDTGETTEIHGYTYDAYGQLTEEVNSSLLGAGYAYDDRENLISVQRQTADGTETRVFTCLLYTSRCV